MMEVNETIIRAKFLKRVVTKEIKHLLYSDAQVFEKVFNKKRAKSLVADEVLAEKVEAFDSRFGRLQDTIGDKLLPFWLQIIEEKTGAFIDNLNKTEK